MHRTPIAFLAQIADHEDRASRLGQLNADSFVAACEKALELSRDKGDWLAEADLLLSATSWDTTQARMAGLIADVMGTRTGASPALLVAAE